MQTEKARSVMAAMKMTAEKAQNAVENHVHPISLDIMKKHLPIVYSQYIERRPDWHIVEKERRRIAAKQARDKLLREEPFTARTARRKYEREREAASKARQNNDAMVRGAENCRTIHSFVAKSSAATKVSPTAASKSSKVRKPAKALPQSLPKSSRKKPSK